MKITVDEATGPGTILRDFNTLLAFINERRPAVPESGHFPVSMLEEINTRLAKPVALDLVRAHQVSYPNIAALHILLRSSGLAIITRSGKKSLLTIDPHIFSAWKSLTDTERYCTLLEVWMLHASLIPKKPSFRAGFDSIKFYMSIGTQGMRIAGDKNAETSITYFPGLIPIAALGLFGIIDIVQTSPLSGKGWRIESIRRTAIGDAVIALFSTKKFFPLYIECMHADALSDRSFNFLQPLLKPCFPDWMKFITVPKAPERKGVFIFKVALYRCWRRIAIPAHYFMDSLASAILNSFDFDHDHLYAFEILSRFGTIVEIHHPYMEEGPWADDVAVGEIPLPVGQEMTYEYDFGDQWRFRIVLENIDEEMKIDTVRCIESHGNAPEQYRP